MEQPGTIELHNGVKVSILAPEFLELWKIAHKSARYLLFGAEHLPGEEINPIVTSILRKVYGVVISQDNSLYTLSRGSLDNTSYEKGFNIIEQLSNAQKKAKNQPDQIEKIALDVVANISTNTGLLTAQS